VHSLHEPIYRERLQKYLDAAKDVFSKLPTRGDIKETITTFHQLEQLMKEIDDGELASIRDERVREAL